MSMPLSISNYRRKLLDIILEDLNMDKFPNLYDPEIYGYNREQKMAILIQQMMYRSIFNSDIEHRYNLAIDVNIVPRQATEYINSAKKEYTKLANYIYHITNKTTKTQFFVTKYPTEQDPNPDILFPMELNKLTVTNIKRVREQIDELQQNIETTKTIMAEYSEPKDNQNYNIINPSSQELIVELPRRTEQFENMNIISKNITIVNDEIRFLEAKIKCLKKMKEEYFIYDTLCIDLVKNEIFLKKHNLRYNLYIKTVKFDTDKVDNLPSDIINIIMEYIGKDYLNKIRQRCIHKKYFPNGREDMRTILKSWKKDDLYNYGQQTFLKYNINTDCNTFRYKTVWIVRSWTKDKMIDHITRNTMIYSFPDFQKDVYLITNILKERRCKKRLPKKH
jgi:hypothetical protein